LRRPLVHTDEPELEPLGHMERRGQVVRPHVGGQAIPCAVGNRKRLVHALERAYGQHRAEDLLTVERCVGREVRDHGGLIEVTGRAIRRTGAAHGHAGAAVAGAGDERFDAVALLGVDERSDLRARVEAVADAQGAGRGGHPLGELRRGVLRDEEPLRRHAHLTAVAELGGGGAGDDGVEIDVREDQHGRVAAEFEREARHRLRGAVHKELPDTRAAGEVDLRHGGACEHGLAHRARVAVHEVHDACRRASLGQQPRHGHARERRVLGGPDDDRAAGGERGAAGAGDVPGGKVPRRDEAHDAKRLLQHEHPLLRHA
jgi:hypothetical protein